MDHGTFDHFSTSSDVRKVKAYKRTSTRCHHINSRLTNAVKEAKKRGDKFLIVWKKCRSTRRYSEAIVTLAVSVNVQMRCPCNIKCRASSAKVLDITNLNGHPLPRAWSGHDGDFVYEVGKVVRPRRAFEKGNTECASGIHFFLTKQEASDYLI